MDQGCHRRGTGIGLHPWRRGGCDDSQQGIRLLPHFMVVPGDPVIEDISRIIGDVGKSAGGMPIKRIAMQRPSNFQKPATGDHLDGERFEARLYLVAT